MTIEYIKNGDLFKNYAEALVCPINCVGVMGKGLALQFKQKDPYFFLKYQKACEAGFISPGSIFIYPTGMPIQPRYYLGFATKDHWRSPSKLEWIGEGLPLLCQTITTKLFRVNTVAVPALGCGEGGLAWADVKPLMEQVFNQYPDILFKIYEPLETTGQ
jgi:O-acetyl-ADP-ribose deacetylase (regulator of RNase III)